jgi:cell shape-determining protein MreC
VLYGEIQDLKETISTQSGNAATIERLIHENTELRTLLGDTPETRIVAGVIARPPYVPYDVLVIDQGSDDGIKTGALVYHASNFVIGYVEKVFNASAIVSLFSSPHSESTVYVFGPDVYATAYGEGGGVIRISVPQGIAIREGNVVVLPMLTAGTLGTVGSITSLPTQPEQHAYLSFPVSMQSVRLVSVAREPIQVVSFDDSVKNIDAYRKKFILEVPPEFRLSVGTTTATATTTDTGSTTTSATTTP